MSAPFTFTNPTPDPRKFQPLPTAPTMPGLPGASGASGAPGGANQFTTAQQLQLQNAFTAAGVWDTIKGLGDGAWDFIAKVLPKNADGSIDWGKAGADAWKWVKDNKQTILDGLSAYNAYQRQNQSDKWATEGLDLAKQEWERKAPLRDAGMAGMLDPMSRTPDLSALSAQGQNGLGVMAPIPIAPSTANLNAAQKIAGPGSGNPFGKAALPVAPIAPPSSPTGMPSTPPVGPRPLTPRPITPLPVAGRPTAAPVVTGTPSGLPVAQSGPIAAGPQNRPFGGMVPNPRAKIAPLPIAGQMAPVNDDPLMRTY